MGHIVRAASRKVVENADGFATLEKCFGEVRTDKARAASDQVSCHVGLLLRYYDCFCARLRCCRRRTTSSRTKAHAPRIAVTMAIVFATLAGLWLATRVAMPSRIQTM